MPRTFAVFQEVVDQGVRAKHYFSDGMPRYADVYYDQGVPHAMHDKSQTYSVEGMNAELRHYLARLHRSSRCFSKCLQALRRAVALFVHFWNLQQLHRRTQPHYRKNLIDFISL